MDIYNTYRHLCLRLKFAQIDDERLGPLRNVELLDAREAGRDELLVHRH